ncbi:MAG: TIGR02757 family protein, partial [Bacteroidetes bacterium]|nr:TIGR02757 family protein [Bacteroidota bacterium]
NKAEFIISDPISIPHLFSKKEDIEISAFLAATIAWGQRVSIVKNAKKLMDLMDMSPYDFIINANDTDFNHFRKFVHRTFNGDDCIFFLKSLRTIYKKFHSLEKLFDSGYSSDKTIKSAIIECRKTFFSLSHQTRVEKHFSDPEKNSACKRINMFLRWMIRNDKHGVDFGIWKNIPPSALFCPLDVHSANVSRKLGLLTRKQNDWKAAEELTSNLRKFDPNDPAKYDFALFGLGIFDKF